VIYERVRAGVPVRHAVPEHAEHLVVRPARQLPTKVHRQRLGVRRQPGDAEDDYNEHDDAEDAGVPTLRLGLVQRDGSVGAQVRDDDDVEGADRRQRECVAEREEC